MNVNNLPEYHELFQGEGGNVTLKVRFATRQEIKERSFPPKQIHWQDVLRLFGGPDGMPFNQMNCIILQLKAMYVFHLIHQNTRRKQMA